jgi:hypothetical protein
VKAILRKIIVFMIAASMMAVSAGVLIVGAASALHGVLEPYVGAPAASALTALAAALLMAGVGLSLERWILRPDSRGHHKGEPAGNDNDLMRKLIGMAQDKPLIATGAMIGAIFLAIRNPALTAIVVKAFLDPKPKPPKKA